MYEASAYFKSLQAGTSAGFQVFGQLIYNIEFDGVMVVHTVHNGDRCDITGLEKRSSLAVYDCVVGADFSGNIFFHNIRNGWKMAEKVKKLRFAGEFPGVVGTDTAVWFYDHRVSNFPDEVLCRCKVRDQMVTCTGNAGFFVTGFHL